MSILRELGFANDHTEAIVSASTTSIHFWRLRDELREALKHLTTGALVVESVDPAITVSVCLAALDLNISCIAATRFSIQRVRKATDAIGIQIGAVLDVKVQAGAARVHVISPAAWKSAGGRERELVFSTSGTTGTPKLVPFDVEQVDFLVTTIQRRLGYAADDIVGSAFQPGFDYGFYQALLCMRTGARFHWFDGLRFLQDAIENLDRYRVSVLPLTPAFGTRLANAMWAQGKRNNSVRLITVTGAQLTATTRQLISGVFPSAIILPMYGLTECKRVAIPTAHAANVPANSVGTPLDGTCVTITKPDGSIAQAHEKGEAIVRGPHVSRGYIGGVDWAGVLHTGDLMSADLDGNLFHHGRLTQDQLKVNDERVSVAEIREIAELFSGGEIVSVDVERGDPEVAVVTFNGASVATEAFVKKIKLELGMKVVRQLRIVGNGNLTINENGKVEGVARN